MANEWRDWFEYETDPNDPTRITMRRLTEEEARVEATKQLMQQIKHYFPEAFERISDVADKFVDEVNAIVEKYDLHADTKAEARKRSRDDLQRKRKEMRKNKNITP